MERMEPETLLHRVPVRNWMLRWMRPDVRSMFRSKNHILASVSRSIVTMLWAAVISDVITAFIGFIFMRHTIKGLSEVGNNTKADIADLAIKKVNSEF